MISDLRGLKSRRGTSCISCRCRTDTGRCGRPCDRLRPLAALRGAGRAPGGLASGGGRRAQRAAAHRARRVGRRRQRELEHELERLRVDPRVHLLEQAEALALIFELRIALSVRAHVDARAQAVHRVQVILPLRVEDLEQDLALAVAEVRIALRRVLRGEPSHSFFLPSSIAETRSSTARADRLAVRRAARRRPGTAPRAGRTARRTAP